MKFNVYFGHIDHKHGIDQDAFETEAELHRWFADYARKNWDDDIGDKPDDDVECAEKYFDWVSEYHSELEWRSWEAKTFEIATDANSKLRGALRNLLDNVYQMQGMFSDEDGTIAEAISSAEEALSNA